MLIRPWMTFGVTALLAVITFGCDDRAQDAVKDAASETGNATREVGRSVSDEVKDAATKTENALTDTRPAVVPATEPSVP